MRNIKCNKIPLKDRGCHFLVGVFVVLLVAYYSPLVGAFMAIVLGGFKEVYDHRSYNGEDYWDFFATVLGAVVGIFIYGLIVEVMKYV